MQLNNNTSNASQEEDSLRLDASIESPEERTALVSKIIDNTPSDKLTPKYLEVLTKYILEAADKEERKKKKILTDNRLLTINKRETSYEGLVSKLENGEDGIHNMITHDKNIILTPKVNFTEADAAIPAMMSLRASIAAVEKEVKNASGRRKFLLCKQLIEMRQDQYVIKNSYNPPKYSKNTIKTLANLDLTEHITIENKIVNGKEKQEIKSDGIISLFNPEHISLLLCNYSRIKEEVYANFRSDTYYLMIDLDNLVEETLKRDFPLYFDLLICKIDGMQNADIQVFLDNKYNVKYSLEYLSSLWRNKIPKLLAEKAKENYLIWYYTEKERGVWKRCSRCGQIKLANQKFFSKNKSSRDGYYSICKKCRSKKGQM